MKICRTIFRKIEIEIWCFDTKYLIILLYPFKTIKISDLEELHNFAHITYALFFSVCSIKHQQPLCASNIYQQSSNNSLINVSIFDIEGRYFFQNYWKVDSTCKRNETFVIHRNLWSIDIFISLFESSLATDNFSSGTKSFQ